MPKLHLVAGAGVAGCAAAVAAARAGARTALLERNGYLGGVATAGLMANIGNLLTGLDGQPVVDGFPRELIGRMVARGLSIRELQRLLLEQGVRLGPPEKLRELGLS